MLKKLLSLTGFIAFISLTNPAQSVTIKNINEYCQWGYGSCSHDAEAGNISERYMDTKVWWGICGETGDANSNIVIFNGKVWYDLSFKVNKYISGDVENNNIITEDHDICIQMIAEGYGTKWSDGLTVIKDETEKKVGLYACRKNPGGTPNSKPVELLVCSDDLAKLNDQYPKSDSACNGYYGPSCWQPFCTGVNDPPDCSSPPNPY